MPEQTKSWTKSVVSVNLAIFFVYFIISAIVVYLDNNAGLPSFILFAGYLLHSALLLLIAFIKFLVWLENRQKTNAGQYILAIFFLLLIGFGACTTLFSLTGGMRGI